MKEITPKELKEKLLALWGKEPVWASEIVEKEAEKILGRKPKGEEWSVIYEVWEECSE